MELAEARPLLGQRLDKPQEVGQSVQKSRVPSLGMYGRFKDATTCDGPSSQEAMERNPLKNSLHQLLDLSH